jgi:hypothetical protein
LDNFVAIRVSADLATLISADTPAEYLTSIEVSKDLARAISPLKAVVSEPSVLIARASSVERRV